MYRVAAAALFSILVATPALAGELKAADARRFVVGKLFAFNCFEGTRGWGRIYHDGSAAGSVQFRGIGPVRYMAMPAGTLKEKGERVCASVKGMPFEPCFNLEQTDSRSFRGSVSGLGFAYCEFTRRGHRVDVAGTQPRRLQSAVATATE